LIHLGYEFGKAVKENVWLKKKETRRYIRNSSELGRRTKKEEVVLLAPFPGRINFHYEC